MKNTNTKGIFILLYIIEVLTEEKALTPDLGGTELTSKVGAEIIKKMQSLA